MKSRVQGRIRPYRDQAGLGKPVTAVPGTLFQGDLPGYCTRKTLYLGTSSHLDTGRHVDTFSMYSTGWACQERYPGPTYREVPYMAIYDPNGPI